MNSILIYDLTGHCNSPLNTHGVVLPWLHWSNCMSIASETKGYRWQSIKRKSIRKFPGWRVKRRSNQALTHAFRAVLSESFPADGQEGARKAASFSTHSFIKTHLRLAPSVTWFFISSEGWTQSITHVGSFLREYITLIVLRAALLHFYKIVRRNLPSTPTESYTFVKRVNKKIIFLKNKPAVSHLSQCACSTFSSNYSVSVY